jgi:tetratricopeptide (TPR) repeat protein
MRKCRATRIEPETDDRLHRIKKEATMIPVTRLFSLGALLILFSLEGWAQTGRLQGELFGSDGAPLPGVVVSLERTDSGGNQTYELPPSNDRGYFTHLSVAPGDYRLTFPHDGKSYFVQARIGAGDVEVELNLQRMTYEANEYSQVAGIVERVVRDITEVGAGAVIIAAPANDEERKAREEAAGKVRESFEAGLAALTAGDYTSAINHFSAAAEGDSNQHVIFGNLGVAYERSGMWPEALAAYQQAQTTAEFNDILPEDANYYSNLTLAHAMNGNVPQALSNAERAAAIDPAAAGLNFYNIGAVLTNQGDSAGAIQAFERAIEVDPGMANAYYEIGLAKIATEATIPEAVSFFERYLSLAPDGENAETAQALLEFAREGQ